MLVRLKTQIAAPPQICFDLSRDIDLHQNTMQHTGERAITGVTSGLIGLGEFVTWEARHFGIKMQLSARITELAQPVMFADEQIKGPFKRLHHRHIFKPDGAGTLMIDEFDFASPLSILGWLADRLVLKYYMTKQLKHRNHIIKKAAEHLSANKNAPTYRGI